VVARERLSVADLGSRECGGEEVLLARLGYPELFGERRLLGALRELRAAAHRKVAGKRVPQVVEGEVLDLGRDERVLLWLAREGSDAAIAGEYQIGVDTPDAAQLAKHTDRRPL
jgi:hypothetical protein